MAGRTRCRPDADLTAPDHRRPVEVSHSPAKSSLPVGRASGMSVSPTPGEIYRRAVVEGERRLSAGGLALVANGFNAGFTIVFGLAALGILHGLVEPRFGTGVAKIAGAAGFGTGLVFLVVSRAELFTENFFDPIATLRANRSRATVAGLLRLWTVVLALNLIGAGLLVLILSVDGVMPHEADTALRKAAEEIAAKDPLAGFANALVGGALVTLLSFLLQAVDRVLSRIVMAYLVGFLLAVGPFAHVVVTAAHLFFGATTHAPIGFSEIGIDLAIALAGNLLGGVAFVSLSHIAQAHAEGG
jgi:formate/nitrite transporter FocA (FNT family)